MLKKQDEFKTNPSNIIVFGAENATFFYQPFEHITGNKIYGMKNSVFNKYIGLFVQQLLNTSVKDCGFSYEQGLTGTREKRRSLMLPINKENTPDWEFMEQYAKNIMYEKYNKYLNFKGIVINKEDKTNQDVQ